MQIRSICLQGSKDCTYSMHEQCTAHQGVIAVGAVAEQDCKFVFLFCHGSHVSNRIAVSLLYYS